MNALTMLAKAKAHANRIAKACNTEIRLAKDMGQGGDRCFVAKEAATYAIVVYLDDPETQCSTGNHAGRFVSIE